MSLGMLSLLMDALFLTSIGCFFALFVTALAIARHVRLESPRRSASRDSEPPVPHASLQQTRATAPSRAEQDLHTLGQHKQPDWRFLISEERRRTSPNPAARKPPTPVRGTTRQRPDWTYFNKDLGDLSDPYEPAQPTSAAGGTRARR